MTPNSSLENLEFFDSFSVDDPLDLDTPVEDPNANIKPDILGGEEFDPLEDEDLDNPPAPPTPPKTPAPAPAEEEEEEIDLEDDNEDEEDNYFEVFGKGLAKAGMLNVDEDEDIEWNEQTFLAKMNETIEDRAWNQ